VKALVENDRLSRLRYEGGLDSYLQVLDAIETCFQGELLQSQLAPGRAAVRRTALSRARRRGLHR